MQHHLFAPLVTETLASTSPTPRLIHMKQPSYFIGYPLQYSDIMPFALLVPSNLPSMTVIPIYFPFLFLSSLATEYQGQK
jgi:hypothetical protein